MAFLFSKPAKKDLAKMILINDAEFNFSIHQKLYEEVLWVLGM
jgi:hypothetical protein